ncbi:hypothetical protein ACVWZK_004214 [Bradyrhizobium sp. GM0.4]
MILLQASIIWSAGMVSVVQSGPSWLRACAKAGADHRVAASRQSATSRRRIGGGPLEERRLLVTRQGKVVHGSLLYKRQTGVALSLFPRWADFARRQYPIPLPTASHSMKNDEILSQITEFCRKADMAESTFGRRAVNDGKLVHRLREGKRITIDTLDRIQAYMAASMAGGVPPPRGLQVPPEKRDPRGNFRFFENRQKYLLFVHTCSEKRVVAERVALELASIHPRPPALRVFDAGVGDGTVLARVLRSMHQRFPHMPFYVAGKELSLEDLRLTLDKVPDRIFEHPASVFVFTNMLYAEAPWLTPASPAAAAATVWHEVPLRGASSGEFETQIAELKPFLEQNWRAAVSPRTGMPLYERPVVLVLYREDQRFLLDSTIPRPGQAEANFDLVIASQPYRALSSVNFRAKTDHCAPGAGLAGRRPPDRNSLPRPGSGHGDDPGDLARRKSFLGEPS